MARVIFASAMAATIFLSTLQIAEACKIVAIDISGNQYLMENPNKHNNAGGGGPGGPGVTIGPVDGFSSVVVQYFAGSNVFPTATPNGFTLPFTPETLIVTADSTEIDFLAPVGGWLFDVTDMSATGGPETFTTGAFSFSGTGHGTDGKDYFLSFLASGTSGTFVGAPVVTSGVPGDPTIDIAHPYTINFFDVFVSLDPVNSPQQPVSKGTLSGVGCTTCTVSLIPEPRTATLLALGLAIFALQRWKVTNKASSDKSVGH
jgi:hypothetical protein